MATDKKVVEHTPGPPATYTLTARVSGEGDDWTDIEMRSATEKYTVATVEDRFVRLFLAAPALLAALKETWEWQATIQELPPDGLAERTKAAIAAAT